MSNICSKRKGRFHVWIRNTTPEYLYQKSICGTSTDGKTKDFTAIRSIDYSEINETFTLTMRNKAFDDQKGCVIQISGINKLYDKDLAGAVCFVDGQVVDNVIQRIENIPETIISIHQDSKGDFYGLTN